MGINRSLQKTIWMHITLLLVFGLISVAFQLISDPAVFAACENIQTWKIVEMITSLKTVCQRSRTGAQYPLIVVMMLFTWLVINCILVYLIIKKISQEKMDEYEVGLGLEKADWRAGFALVIVVLVCLIAAWAVLTTGANPEAFSGRARYLSNAFLQPVFAALQMLILVVSSYVLFIPFVYYVGKFFKFLWRKV